MPKWVFWETIFELWEHQCLFFLCFHYWDLMTNNWHFINCHRKRTRLNNSNWMKILGFWNLQNKKKGYCKPIIFIWTKIWLMPCTCIGPKRFWSGLNEIFLDQYFCNLNLTKTNWARLKRLVLGKIIWTVLNYFGPMEGQDISYL